MTAPAFSPAVIGAARDAAKLHLRIAGESEDAAIEQFAATALALGEAFTGTAWIARDWDGIVAASGEWQRLAMAPVTAITGVEGLPAEGAGFALAAGDYAIDIDSHGEGWVRVVSPGSAGRVRVAYGAGAAADWASLPPPLAQGAVLLIAHLFSNRDSDAAPPAAVAALWRPWRRMRIGGEMRP